MLIVRQQRLMAEGGQAPPHLGLHLSKQAAQAIVCMRVVGAAHTRDTKHQAH